MKLKRCKQCGKEFKPINSLQNVCSYICALKFNSKKEVEKRIKVIKKGLVTHSELLRLLQVTFNTYIRLRDKDKKCISCDVKLSGKYDAGHFWSVGAYSGLRFNEDNVHGQCVHCNQHLHGNLLEYRIRLENRIGSQKFRELEAKRHFTNKLSQDDITDLITEYKVKINELK